MYEVEERVRRAPPPFAVEGACRRTGKRRSQSLRLSHGGSFGQRGERIRAERRPNYPLRPDWRDARFGVRSGALEVADEASRPAWYSSSRLCDSVWLPSGRQPPFARGPYSGAPTEDSVVISWVVAPPLPASSRLHRSRRGFRETCPIQHDLGRRAAQRRDGQVDVPSSASIRRPPTSTASSFRADRRS